MRKSLIVALFAALLVPSVAAAQPKGKDKQPRGVILIDVVTITGRIQKPVAAVDVARLRPQLTLSELRQPFLKRIDRAVYDNPF